MPSSNCVADTSSTWSLRSLDDGSRKRSGVLPVGLTALLKPCFDVLSAVTNMTAHSVTDRSFTPVTPGVQSALWDAKKGGEVIEAEEVVIDRHCRYSVRTTEGSH